MRMESVVSKSKLNKIRILEVTDSSLVSGIGYLQKEKILALEMNSERYVFFDVPYTKFLGMVQASSMGKFYNEMIKGKYSSDKIDN
jgi:hypothetical protein